MNVSTWAYYNVFSRQFRYLEYQMVSGKGLAKLVDNDKSLLEGKRAAGRLGEDLGFPFC